MSLHHSRKKSLPAAASRNDGAFLAMRTITLEILRHGPPHNQLLSPLTLYLAICENHAGVTVHLPFEHNQFLHRLRALNYEIPVPEERAFQLRDTAQVLGELLSAIPGLTAELSREC